MRPKQRYQVLVALAPENILDMFGAEPVLVLHMSIENVHVVECSLFV